MLRSEHSSALLRWPDPSWAKAAVAASVRLNAIASRRMAISPFLCRFRRRAEAKVRRRGWSAEGRGQRAEGLHPATTGRAAVFCPLPSALCPLPSALCPLLHLGRHFVSPYPEFP